jgi:hypothetical protein
VTLTSRRGFPNGFEDKGGEENAFQHREYQHVLVECQTYCARGPGRVRLRLQSSSCSCSLSFSIFDRCRRGRASSTCEHPGAVRDKALFNLMRCPYCRTNVTWGAIACPTCRAQISYGCTVPATGCLLAVVVAFLAGSALVGLCSPGESAGDGKLSQNLLLGIGVFSALLGLGLWLLMYHVAKRFVSFAPKRRD